MNGYATSSLKLIFDADNSIRCVPNYKTKAGEPVETFVSTGSPAAFGAADEARTRYLHLGKVALYQMSYGRIKKSPKTVR